MISEGWRICFALGLGTFLSVPARSVVPEAGLAAETAGDWQSAAEIYRDATQQESAAHDAELWTRVGQVEARLGRADAAAAAYARAADLRRDDADAQREASRAYAVAQQPHLALDYLERALALRPQDETLQLDRVQLANWSGDYALAEQTLEQLLSANPARTDILADLARVRAWQGRLHEADQLFARHLGLNADDATAWLDRARIATWRGDYASALELLAAHDLRFPERSDQAANAERARALAWAGHRRAALELNAALRREQGDTYALLFTETLAQRASLRPADALPWLARTLALQPDTQESSDLARGTRLPLRSRIGIEVAHFEDSAGIAIDTLGTRGAWRFTDPAWLHGELQQREFGAPSGIFAAIDGRTHLEERRSLLGVAYAPRADLAFNVTLGTSQVDQLGTRTIGRVQWNWQADDALSWRLDAGRDRLAASPRSLSLDLQRRWLGAEFEWRPDLRWRALWRLEHAHQNDGNRAWAFDASALRAVHRSQQWQWDTGASLAYLSFDKPAPERGYYAPERYRRVQLNARGYWRWNDDCGLALDFATGVQRDESMASWRGAYDVSAEAIFGIFADWELRLRTAYSDRRQASGNFDGHSFGLRIERRF